MQTVLEVLFALAVFIPLGYAFWLYLRKTPPKPPAPLGPFLPHTPRPPAPNDPPTPAEPFGYKIAWWAVRSDDPKAVSDAFLLRDQQQASWKRGIDEAYFAGVREGSSERNTFVTPSIEGWVLVVGTELGPDWRFSHPERKAITVAALRHFAELFGEVQIFSTSRSVGSYSWGRATRDGVLRYLYSFDEFYSIGPPDAFEESLGLNDWIETAIDLFGQEADVPAERKAGRVALDDDDEDYWDYENHNSADEQDVTRMAGHWSIDPSTLDERGLPPAYGILGLADRNFLKALPSP